MLFVDIRLFRNYRHWLSLIGVVATDTCISYIGAVLPQHLFLLLHLSKDRDTVYENIFYCKIQRRWSYVEVCHKTFVKFKKDICTQTSSSLSNVTKPSLMYYTHQQSIVYIHKVLEGWWLISNITTINVYGCYS